MGACLASFFFFARRSQSVHISPPICYFLWPLQQPAPWEFVHLLAPLAPSSVLAHAADGNRPLGNDSTEPEACESFSQ